MTLKHILLALCLLSACCHAEDRRGRADSLNEAGWEWRYRQLDSLAAFSRRVLAWADRGSDGWSEATCNLAFASAMRMDYAEATRLYSQVEQESGNELLRMVADVGMMRVCQRQSANKDFYLYKGRAERRWKRIEQEQSLMNAHQRRLWNAARSDFHMILSTYYYYLRQENDGMAALRSIEDDFESVEGDTAQLAYYYFLKGNARTVGGVLPEEQRRLLIRSMTLARNAGCGYIYGKCYTSIAEDLTEAGDSFSLARVMMLREQMAVPDTVTNRHLPLWMAERAMQVFEQYGSDFDVAQTYIMMADYYMKNGEAAQALPLLLVARDIAEKRKNVPELTIDVFEELSIVYSALGMKTESDECRNVYLDVLEANRQDLKMAQRLDELREEERGVKRTLWLVGAGMMLLLLAVMYLSRRIRKGYASRAESEHRLVEAEIDKWRKLTDENVLLLEQRGDDVRSERSVQLKRLEERKCRYIERATQLSILTSITPLLDRALRAMQGPREADLQYVGELLERVEQYNTLLSHWIKIRQGVVGLNIENFQLQPLFDILQGSCQMFRQNGLTLEIQPTDVVLKADRALTLFMMNTLLDNARKYTAEGGHVRLAAQELDGMVEIEVSDTGCGLSPQDINTILNEKVYDASTIGTATAEQSEGNTPSAYSDTQTKRKGFGFGLMNCKGIIEKYRRTGSLFANCAFLIESKEGEGSCFKFRLPKGVMRAMGVLAMLFAMMQGAGAAGEHPYTSDTLATRYDKLHALAQALPEDYRLEKASAFADSAYFANIDRRYEDALLFVDSACVWLNQFYLSKQPHGKNLLTLAGNASMPDIELWEEQFNTDYHIILDIRNEAAVAALALNKWDIYRYNNEIYTRLFKLMAQDTTLEQYCENIEQANATRRTLTILLVILLSILAFWYLSVYYRNKILPAFMHRQILEAGRRIFASTDDLHLADIVYEGIRDIRPTLGVGIMHGQQCVFSEGCPQTGYLMRLMKELSGTTQPMHYDGGRISTFPLLTEDGEAGIGVLAFVMPEGHELSDEAGNVYSLIAQYVATNICYSALRKEQLENDIQLTEDDMARARREADRLHVQNMILDNCLSTIKHETMYYPSRIQQMLRQQEADTAQILEVLAYYKNIFNMLLSQAYRQLGHVPLNREEIPVAEIVDMVRSQGLKVESSQAPCSCIADRTMLSLLLDNLLKILNKQPATLKLEVTQQDRFMQFNIIHPTLTMPRQRLDTLFYPETIEYDAATGHIEGQQWLIAKQIIREHDQHVRRGCRIEANTPQGTETGLSILFTLPRKMLNNNLTTS